MRSALSGSASLTDFRFRSGVAYPRLLRSILKLCPVIPTVAAALEYGTPAATSRAATARSSGVILVLDIPDVAMTPLVTPRDPDGV